MSCSSGEGPSRCSTSVESERGGPTGGAGALEESSSLLLSATALKVFTFGTEVKVCILVEKQKYSGKSEKVKD